MQLTAQFATKDSSKVKVSISYTHETRIDNAVSIDAVAKEKSREPPGQAWRDSGVDVEDKQRASANGASLDSQADALQPDKRIGMAYPAAETLEQATTAQPAGRCTAAPFHIMKPVCDSNQSVTYSSWQVDSLNEIADALNISSFARVKYATVEASANASMIHESKLADSQLNYMVSVKVTNDSEHLQEPMVFQPIEGLPPERFTQVYGDCFISGFLEGGEFQAIISIKCNDKSKLKQVKEAVDFELGWSWRESQQGSFGSKNTETTISVRCNGGGVIKEPGTKWTLDSVVALANAFPSLVAACPSKTSAVLIRYQSLNSFQEWMWKMSRDPSWHDFVNIDDHWQNRLVLSYAPCHIYTASLYDDLMKYKSLQRRIRDIMEHSTRYKPRSRVDGGPEPKAFITPHPEPPSGEQTPAPQAKRVTIKTNGDIKRGATFGLQDPDNSAVWELSEIDRVKDPLSVDIDSMKKADLLCRAALTLITEEAARLVDHPHLAYAEFDDRTHKIRINKPNYPVPELLEQRLPVFSGNDATDETMSDDQAVLFTMQHAHGDDLYFHLVGDVPNPHRTYKSFCSLDVSDPRRSASSGSARIKRISIHGYTKHWWNFNSYWKSSNMAIGAIGLKWSKGAQPKSKQKVKPDGCTHHFGGRLQSTEAGYRTIDLDAGSQGPLSGAQDSTAAGIARIDIQYLPGDGRIAALTFYETPPDVKGSLADKSLPVLTWRQWDHDGSDGRQPEGLKTVTQSPPQDGSRWVFVGVCGAWDAEGLLRGNGKVLARVSGIWRRL